MSCCTSYLSLGCSASCGTLVLDANATATGTYSVVVEGGYAFSVSTTIGEAIEIDLSNFNESSTVKFQVLDENNDPVVISSAGVDYSCFKLNTSIVLNVETTTSSDTDCCNDPLIIQVPSDQTYYTISAATWAGYGSIPTIEVFVDPDGSGYTQIQLSAVYTGFPTPTSITVTIPGAVAAWYIKISK